MISDNLIIDYLMIENTLEAFVTIDNHKIINCDNRFVKILGYNLKEEIVNANLYELTPSIQSNKIESIDLIKTMTSKAFLDGKSRFECQFKKSDGKIIWTKILFIKQNFKEKNIISCVIRDISIIKNLLNHNKDCNYNFDFKHFNRLINDRKNCIKNYQLKNS